MKRKLLKLLIVVCSLVIIFSYIQGSSELIKKDGSLIRVSKITDKYKINLTDYKNKQTTTYYINQKYINKGLQEGITELKKVSKKDFDNRKVGDICEVKLNHSINLLEMRSEYLYTIISMITFIIGICGFLYNYKDKIEIYLIFIVSLIILILGFI